MVCCLVFFNKRKASSLRGHFSPSLVTYLYKIKMFFYSREGSVTYKELLTLWQWFASTEESNMERCVFKVGKSCNSQTWAMKVHTTSKTVVDGTKRKQGQILDQSTVKKWLNWCLKDFLTNKDGNVQLSPPSSPLK